MGTWTAKRVDARGFSLIELLVVLLIFAILIAIAVPSLIASQPERNLAAAAERFANDMNYARSKAESSGNSVYVGFQFSLDEDSIEGRVDETETNGGIIGGLLDIIQTPSLRGDAFINPGNPGVARTAKGYYIVEERPRFKADGSPYTYLDWLNDYDNWDASDNDPPYPVEPQFPYDAEETASTGVLPNPKLGSFAALAAPLVAYPQQMIGADTNTDYVGRFLGNIGLFGGDWSTGDARDQQFKTFSVADEVEILNYDQNDSDANVDFYPPGDTSGLRTYDPVPGGSGGGNSGSAGDHPRLKEQVTDYVLLKRVSLPDHVSFYNPWKNRWVVGWEDFGNQRVYASDDMQFLQHLWGFHSNGEVTLNDWTFDPDPFPSGTIDGLNHGIVGERSGVPIVRSMWMVLDETLDFAADAALVANRKSNLDGSGRIFSLWPLNGQYYVDDYAPNDVGRVVTDVDDTRLNLSNTTAAREFGYAQNFLVPAP